MHKLINSSAIILLLLLSLLTVWPIFLSGYFSHHDDLQVMRIFEMRKCFSDLQIPCRWVPDMGYGNGFPLFNYYGVFPYYLGAILSFFVGFVWAAKLLFFIPLVLGGISMYLLGKEIFGKIPGVVAGVLYLFAPYRAVDAYVRGAVSESFALALIPLVFYFILRLSKEKKLNNFLLLSAVTAFFLTTHNIMTMFFMPVIALWSIYCLWTEKFKNIFPLVSSFILGIGLSAFFLLPAFLENNLVQTETLTRFDLDFRVHFVTLNQLFFSRFWGYGASILGPEDQLSFQIGWPLWWFVPVGLIVWLIIAKKQKEKQMFIPGALLLIFLFSILMTHNKSAFIWEKIGILRFTQFPWRFLSLTIFSASLLGGFVLTAIKGDRNKKIAAGVIIIITILLNWNYFRPKEFYSFVNDESKLSGMEWETQQKAAILDYLPKTALEPREPASFSPIVVSGKAEIKDFENKSSSWQFKADVSENSNIEVPVFDFPNWEVRVNGEKFTHSHDNFLGRIRLDLQPGSYLVVGEFKNTMVRDLANVISLVSLLVLVVIFAHEKVRKYFI